MAYPILKACAKARLVSGNCAIAIGNKQKQAVTWDMLRIVAETLLATCVSSPISGALGGTAISQPVVGKRKRNNYRRQTGKIPNLNLDNYS